MRSMLMKFGWALAACFLALAGAPAFAQAPAGGPGGGMDRLMAQDTNHDGSISLAEAQAARGAMFDRMDTNHDGAISAAEKQAALAAAPGGGRFGGRMLDNADANHDGAITRAEFMAMPYRMFERGDTNHNNVLEPSEIAAMRAMMGH